MNLRGPNTDPCGTLQQSTLNGPADCPFTQSLDVRLAPVQRPGFNGKALVEYLQKDLVVDGVESCSEAQKVPIESPYATSYW